MNPTFVEGIPWVDNVAYADVLEFDYSGTFLMYDAYTVTENAEGEDLSHWVIGLLKFWENGEYTSNTNPKIRRLISQLPDNVGVADPAFSKNSKDLIAFDYYIDLPMTVLNLLGQPLIQRTQSLMAGDNQFEVNLQSLPTGNYLVRILAGKTQGVVKVVKN